MDIFEKFSAELLKEKKEVIEGVGKFESKLSTPKNIVNFSLRITTNLPSVWASDDLHKKQVFQNMMFPKGLLAFDWYSRSTGFEF